MSIYLRTVTAVTLALLAGVAVYANEMNHEMHSAKAEVSGGDKADLEAARADYPMTTCVVSGDELGGGGMEVFEYMHKEEGKPDRLVRFCCKDCVRDFKKTPTRYLAKIDAAKSQLAGKGQGEKSSGHEGHQH